MVQKGVEKEKDRRGAGRGNADRRSADPRSPEVPPPAQREAAVSRRLARIEGQVRGVIRMLEEERDCVDVLNQIAAVHQGLRQSVRELLVAHMERCVHDAMESGDTEECRRVSEEVAELIFKYSR